MRRLQVEREVRVFFHTCSLSPCAFQVGLQALATNLGLTLCPGTDCKPERGTAYAAFDGVASRMDLLADAGVYVDGVHVRFARYKQRVQSDKQANKGGGSNTQQKSR